MVQLCFQDEVWLAKSDQLLIDISTLKRLFSLKDKFYDQTKSGKPKETEGTYSVSYGTIVTFFLGGRKNV